MSIKEQLAEEAANELGLRSWGKKEVLIVLNKLEEKLKADHVAEVKQLENKLAVAVEALEIIAVNRHPDYPSEDEVTAQEALKQIEREG